MLTILIRIYYAYNGVTIYSNENLFYFLVHLKIQLPKSKEREMWSYFIGLTVLSSFKSFKS